MTYAKSIVMGTGGVVLAGLILTLLAPRAVHAVVATAVQVMNTSASPVPNKDVDEPARTAFTTSCRTAQNLTQCAAGGPGGSLFVVETISADAGGQFVQVEYGSAQGDQQVFLPLAQVDSSDFIGTFPVRLYVASNANLVCSANVKAICTFSGHLVSIP